MKPEYRPYKDYNEMVSDYCERFGVARTDYSIPLIWVKEKDEDNVTQALWGYYGNIGFEALIGGSLYEADDLLNLFTYLDGSPVGKEIEE